MNLDDTIVAIATPPGRGGIGVMRIAGPEARAMAEPMLRLKHELEPGRAVFGELIEPAGREGFPQNESLPEASSGRAGVPERQQAAQRIDEVVVTYFAKPHSYTTDDIVEISAHGSPVVLRHMLELALSAGARLAEPGEFTLRAFLNGRIDLTQAEAVRDLIESQTLFQAKVAAQQLEGALSRRLQPIKQKLVELIALLEAGIDFAEDDVSVLPGDRILQSISEIRSPLTKLAESFAYGKMVHEGMTLAIVGRPNVGKSSLFNCLVERERAIVTATPGTTRDLVSETVAIGGIPVTLVDTAGIRTALDEAESIGIGKSMEALADADLALVVVDASQPISQEDRALIERSARGAAILVENKCDLPPRDEAENDSTPPGPGNAVRRRGDGTGETSMPRVRTSALSGDGIDGLKLEIQRQIGGDGIVSGENSFVTNARHQALVRDAVIALDCAERAVCNKVPHEMLILDLYNAMRLLDEITGATTTDDILNLIFSRFCIGK